MRDDRGSTEMFAGSASIPASTSKYYFNFALYPLVSSSGPDGRQDIIRFDYDPDTPNRDAVGYHCNRIVPPYPPVPTNPPSTHFNESWPQNDPYAVLPTCGRRLGEPYHESEGYSDNIINHALGG